MISITLIAVIFALIVGAYITGVVIEAHMTRTALRRAAMDGKPMAEFEDLIFLEPVK